MGILPLYDIAFNLMCELCPNRSRWKTTVAVFKVFNSLRRELLIGIACVALSIGEMVLPLLGETKILTSIIPSNSSGWLFASWRFIKIASVIPLFVFFVSWKLIPESPRWLVCKSRTKEATEILTRIATTNSADVPGDLEASLQRMTARKGSQSSCDGFLSVLSSPILFLRTAMLAIGLSASIFVLFQIYSTIANMTYKRHLNMLILALISLPGRVLGEYWVALHWNDDHWSSS